MKKGQKGMENLGLKALNMEYAHGWEALGHAVLL